MVLEGTTPLYHPPHKSMYLKVTLQLIDIESGTEQQHSVLLSESIAYEQRRIF